MKGHSDLAPTRGSLDRLGCQSVIKVQSKCSDIGKISESCEIDL